MRQQFMLTMWTVYDHPSDFPGHYVARLWRSGVRDGKPTVEASETDVLKSEDLGDLRQQINRLGFCSRILRSRGDDPCIVEVWL